MDVEQEFTDLITNAVEGLGTSLKIDVDLLALYAAERMEHLSLLVGQEGFSEAVIAERDNVVLEAGILATRQADIADQRLVGIIQGALYFGAVALANT